ncbi:MAG: hypothetical protein A3F09_01605 [Chlamydiae bacterium RIFCSPHIGHO2_12_FULL_49_11]|nr:MAG: hypothetical protein A3F09_01605 [Chlamydiae bacterium RIFCSPHIGHO2_12_FULL_49_11]
MQLSHFRSFEKFEIEFQESGQLLVGENGVGKTSLLEALSLLFTGRSFRTHKLSDMVRYGAPGFSIEAIFSKTPPLTESIRINYELKENRKEIFFNRTSLSTFTPLIGRVPLVSFVPTDIELIMSSPAFRRRFMNLLLSQRSREYLLHFARYTRALKHKNALLKQEKWHLLEPFEIEMDRSGSYLIAARRTFLFELQEKADPYFQCFHGAKQITFTYEENSRGVPLLQAWKEGREKELRYALCCIGPHRDDFQIRLDHKPAKQFASEGQKRALLAALKLAELSFLENPVFLIDDFGTHLDATNEAAFLEAIRPLSSVFITSTRDLFTHSCASHAFFLSGAAG